MTLKKFVPFYLLFLMTCTVSMQAQEPAPDPVLKLVQDRVGNTQKRSEAMAEMIETREASIVISTLLDFIRRPGEDAALRGQASHFLMQIDNADAREGLLEILETVSNDTSARSLALYTLWRKQPESFLPYLTRIAEDQVEDTRLRATALTYLASTRGEQPVSLFATLLRDRDNPIEIRVSALLALHGSGTLSGPVSTTRTLMLQIVRDPTEETELRKPAITIASQTLTPIEFERLLLNVLSRTANAVEMRRLAVTNLESQANPLILPNVKKILAEETDLTVITDLERLISALEEVSAGE
jgi:HEAT repeat protein